MPSTQVDRKDTQLRTTSTVRRSRPYLYTYSYAAIASFIMLTLASCGGGGGGSSTPAPAPAPAPVANVAPSANFTVTDTSGPAPLLLSVDATASTDSDGSIVSYTWDFGDGDASAIGTSAQHSYSEPGSFVIELTVTDDDGASATRSQSIEVEDTAGTASISGTITILSSSAVDADVNDRLTAVGDNNSFANAQPLPLPVSLGGFANRPNTGASSGNLFASGDPGDFYQLEFAGNEVVLLTIAESNADLDLRLYDAGQNLVEASLGTDRTESISVTIPGSYFVEVFAVSGASNYILNVGQDLAISASSNGQASRLSDGFVAGEVMLMAANPAARNSQGVQTQMHNRYGLSPASAPGGGIELTQMRRSNVMGPNPAANLGTTAVDAMQLPKEAQASAAIKLKHDTLMQVKHINASEPGMHAEVNLLRQISAIPNDVFFNRQWHYQNINLPVAWDTTTGSPDVIVAVVDTGLLTAHPDLQNQLVPGFDFVSSVARSNDGDGIDSDPNDPGDLGFGGSSSFHGTHVAGTVAAETDNNLGVAGVAWQSRIMPVRALGVDGGTNFDVIQAIRFAAGLSNNSNTLPAVPADIINLSLGSEFSSQAEQQTLTQVINSGIIVVASAGNDSSSIPSFPAAYDGVVSVAATTIDNSIASYSNRGTTIDIAAPGGNTSTDLNGDGIGDGVVSTIGDDGGGAVQFGFAALNGTSMASPHVAGVAALMKAVFPALTPAQFNNALVAGDITDDLGAPGRDNIFGAGLINAQKAVLAAQSLANGGGSDPGPILAASASSLNFGAFSTSQDWQLQNIGSGDLVVGNLTSSEPWATATPSNIDANGIGEYQINVDRTGLADGSYTADITATSNSNQVTLRVIMQVTSASPSADAGLHYVIAVDDEGDSVVPADVISANNGTYNYQLNDVPFGEYRIFAGSDADDDNFLCDAGEACGSFRTLDSPDRVVINADTTGIDFTTTFQSNLSTISTATDAQANDDNAAGFAIDKPNTNGNIDKSAGTEQ